MLIGHVLQLSFAGYNRMAILPSLVGLIAAWGVISWFSRGRWQQQNSIPPVTAPPFNRWQTIQGLGIVFVVRMRIG